MNYLKKFQAILLFLLFVFVGSASAETQFAQSVVYFDADGTPIGQKILYCNNYIEAAGQVQTSPYHRLDEILCGDYLLRGTACNDVQTITGGNAVFGSTTYVCNPIVVSVQPGSVQSTSYNLPPGMTLEQSCMSAPCSSNLPEPDRIFDASLYSRASQGF